MASRASFVVTSATTATVSVPVADRISPAAFQDFAAPCNDNEFYAFAAKGGRTAPAQTHARRADDCRAAPKAKIHLFPRPTSSRTAQLTQMPLIIGCGRRFRGIFAAKVRSTSLGDFASYEKPAIGGPFRPLKRRIGNPGEDIGKKSKLRKGRKAMEAD
jgi:hypothetical protein